jgi:hypothetical protein
LLLVISSHVWLPVNQRNFLFKYIPICFIQYTCYFHSYKRELVIQCCIISENHASLLSGAVFQIYVISAFF